jgi:organic radical activating enzyme
MLNQWYRKYFRQVKTAADAKACVEDFKYAIGDRKIALYGAGVIGNLMRSLLLEFEIPAALVIDKFKSGAGIVSPSAIKALNAANYLFLAVLDPTNLPSVKKELVELGLAINLIEAMDFTWLLQVCSCVISVNESGTSDFRMCEWCCARQPNCAAITAWQRNRGTVVTGQEHYPCNGQMAFEIGTVCNLRCKGCSVGMPYAIKKEFRPTEEIVRDMHRIYDAYPLVNKISISGGECTLHPDFLEIVKQALLIFENSIIFVLTNGTVILSDDMLKSLQDERIVVQLSYYNNISERFAAVRKENIARLETSSIAYIVKNRQDWQKLYDPADSSQLGAPTVIETDEKELARKFQYCTIRKTCGPLVCYGRYCLDSFGCLFIYKNDIYVENIPPITEITNEELWHYNEHPPQYLEACKYCIGPDFEMIPAAEQIGGNYE